jgi:glycosyltransferase involved in cell wall biosynthesis
MKILVVTHKPFFPKIDGGCFSTAQLISGLNNSGIELRIATITTPKHPFDATSFPKDILKKIQLYHFIDTTNTVRNFKSWLSTSRSIFTQRFYDERFLRKLVDLCKSFAPDYIHFESLFSAVYLPELRKTSSAKMLVRTHNIEYQLWQDRIRNGGAAQQLLLSGHVKRLESEEIELLRAADGIVAISQNEFNFFKQFTSKPCLYLPTGVEVDDTESHYGNDFFCLASMDWRPNVNGLSWFLKEVWLKYDCAKNNILHLAGKGLDKEAYSEIAGLKNHGMVADSKRFMCDFGIMLVPLFQGSGLRIKIIEAGALGVPIIATAKAVEGIGLQKGKHFLEANNAAEFAQAMQLLMNDVSLRRNLGTALRAFMNENYNPEQLNSRLIEFYRNI